MLGLQIFVIHVKGDKQRAEHINNELSKFNLEAEFILDGNIEDITEQRLDKYFDGKMHTISATTSCSLKHIIAYEQILKRNIDKVLIFEDDIILKSNFIQIIEQILLEIENRGLANYIVSLENTNHAYIKKNELINNQILYKKETSRCAGAYLIDYEGAKNIIAEIQNNKCNLQIDWLHNNMSDNKGINIFWSNPHIAEQASHNGKLGSLLDDKKTGNFRRIIYFLQGKIKKRWAPMHH